MALATIISGSGRMGAWFAHFLAANGYEVMICDKNESAARKLAERHGFKFIKSEIQRLRLSSPTS